MPGEAMSFLLALAQSIRQRLLERHLIIVLEGVDGNYLAGVRAAKIIHDGTERTLKGGLLPVSSKKVSA